MRQLLKILLSEPEVRGAIHFRGAAHEVVATRLKGLAMLIKPGVLRDVATLLEHLFSVPVLGFLGQPIAPFEHEHLQPAGTQMAGQGAPTGTTTDDHHIKVGSIGHIQLLGLGQGRAINRWSGELGSGGRVGHGEGRDVSDAGYSLSRRNSG